MLALSSVPMNKIPLIAFAVVGIILGIRVFTVRKRGRDVPNPFEVLDPVWIEGQSCKLCTENDPANKCLTVGPNPVQYLDLMWNIKSFQLYDFDGLGGLTATFVVDATTTSYTENQSALTFTSPVTSITLGKPTAAIRLWSEENYRGRHTTLQGEGPHQITAALETLVAVCEADHKGNLHNYYYGQDFDETELVERKDCVTKGHVCTLNSEQDLTASQQLSFTFEPFTADT
jgi:hypothetical protein